MHHVKRRRGEGGRRCAGLLLLIALLLTVESALAAYPEVHRIDPPGGQRGTKVELDLRGRRLKDAAGLLLYRSGVSVEHVEAVNDKHVRLTLRVDGAAPLGEHPFRLRSRSGVSDLHTLHIGDLPERTEDQLGDNDDFETAPRIESGVTINGRIDNEDVDLYRVELAKGERLSAEVVGMRLGRGMFDPYLDVLDARRFSVAACDDSALALQDPLVSFIAPEAGVYVIRVREASYGGGREAQYRLHVGPFPRPTVAYPPGLEAGQLTSVRYLGDPAGEMTAEVKADEPGRLERHPADDHGVAPSPVLLRVDDLPTADEAEPNDHRGQATEAGPPAPLAMHGVIDAAGDHDWFSFEAKKGQQYEVTVEARSLRSPLDAAINVFGPDGKHVQGNDDRRGSLDSELRFRAPEDGRCFLRVRDHRDRGGPTFVYRVEVRRPRASLGVTLPEFARNSQERQAMAVPRGGRFAVMMDVQRQNAGGPVELAIDGLPEGVRWSVPAHADTGGRQVPVVFEADADAPLSGSLAAVTVRHADENRDLVGGYEQRVPLVRGNGNTTFYQVTVDRLAAAVTEAAPVAVRVEPPATPLVQGGQTALRVAVERGDGFDGRVELRLLDRPPGVGAANVVRVQPNQSHVDYPLNANDRARVGDAPIVVLAKVYHHGPLWTAAAPVTLQVAEPFVTARLDMAAVTRGEAGRVVCRLNQQRVFEGEARIELLGLPHQVRAEPKTFTAEDEAIVFDVQTGDGTPTRTHRSLHCRITIDGEAEGASIVSITGRGGVLRVDKPRKTEVASSQPKPDPEPEPQKQDDAPPPEPLSRLEQLRKQLAEEN